MLARLEICHSLAPIQDYGRHQTRAQKLKKKKEKEQPEQVEGSENKEKEQLDDKFYDLDDAFIDDGDLDGEHEMIGPDLFLAESDMMMSEPGTLTNRLNEANVPTEQRQEMEYQQMLGREKRENDRIKERFKVMSAEDIEKLL